MKRLSLIYFLSCFVLTLSAQNYRDYIRRGNRSFRDTVYDKAQVQYQKGFELDSNSVQINYNLANTLMRQGQPKEALQLLDKTFKMESNPIRRHQICHNMGVILQAGQDYAHAIEYYKEALRCDPTDNETRYNLVLCQRLLKNQPQGGGQDNKEGDKQDKDQQKQDQQQQQQKKDDKQQKQRDQESQMSKENAEQMLNAAMQNERQTQDKVKQKVQNAQHRRLQKQW